MRSTTAVKSPKIIVLDYGNFTSCTVNLHGATVTSWRIKNQEMIFVSRRSPFSDLSHIRGGIQFVFPVLESWKFGPRNGFARNLLWTLERGPEKLETGDIVAEVSLKDNPYTRSIWNYKFKLHYMITLYEKTISFSIGVENRDETSLEFSIMQHCWLRVPDVSKCTVVGLQGYTYHDLLRDNNVYEDESESLTICGEINRLYFVPRQELHVDNTVKGGTIKIRKKQTKEVNLWNPWSEGILHISNTDSDEYKYFIAIETGVVSTSLCLESLSCWSAFQSFEYIEKGDTKKKKTQNSIKHYYDWFEGYC